MLFAAMPVIGLGIAATSDTKGHKVLIATLVAAALSSVSATIFAVLAGADVAWPRVLIVAFILAGAIHGWGTLIGKRFRKPQSDRF